MLDIHKFDNEVQTVLSVQCFQVNEEISLTDAHLFCVQLAIQ